MEKNFSVGAYAGRNAAVVTPQALMHYDFEMHTYPVFRKPIRSDLQNRNPGAPVGYISVVVQPDGFSTVEYTCLSIQAYENLRPAPERRKAAERATSGL